MNAPSRSITDIMKNAQLGMLFKYGTGHIRTTLGHKCVINEGDIDEIIKAIDKEIELHSYRFKADILIRYDDPSHFDKFETLKRVKFVCG